MKKVVSSLTGLAVAMPLSIGVALADDTNEMKIPEKAMTQECVTARTAADDVLIATKNTQHSAEIAAIQAHKAAIIAAAELTDATAKAAAFKKAEMDHRLSMKLSMEAFRTATKESMETMKAACGTMKGANNHMMGNGEKGPRGRKGGMMQKLMNSFGKGRGHNAVTPSAQ